MPGKPRKPVPAPPTPGRPARRAGLRRAATQFAAGVAFLGVLAAALWYARGQVQRRLAYSPDPPQVVLVDRPAWMSDAVVEELTRTLRPATGSDVFDADLLRTRAALLERSPWVRRVIAVRRAYVDRPGDTLLVQCEFRAPLALVKWQDYYWLVDNEGYKLPEQYTADEATQMLFDADRRTMLRIVEGVNEPPVESGRRWPGADLAAGLELAKLLYGQRFADEVVKVDVSNFAGRVDPREAQLVLITRYGTELRWGRPPGAKDAFVEIPAARKLEAMEQVWTRFGRIDANQPWLDVRFDQVTYPTSASTSADPPAGP